MARKQGFLGPEETRRERVCGEQPHPSVPVVREPVAPMTGHEIYEILRALSKAKSTDIVLPEPRKHPLLRQLLDRVTSSVAEDEKWRPRFFYS